MSFFVSDLAVGVPLISVAKIPTYLSLSISVPAEKHWVIAFL
jgi:hypothetical protein